MRYAREGAYSRSKGVLARRGEGEDLVLEQLVVFLGREMERWNRRPRARQRGRPCGVLILLLSGFVQLIRLWAWSGLLQGTLALCLVRIRHIAEDTTA